MPSHWSSLDQSGAGECIDARAVSCCGRPHPSGRGVGCPQRVPGHRLVGARLPTVGVCRSDPPRDRLTSSGLPGSSGPGRRWMRRKDGCRRPRSGGGGGGRLGASGARRGARRVGRAAPVVPGDRGGRGHATRRGPAPSPPTGPAHDARRAAHGPSRDQQRCRRVAARPRAGRRVCLRAARAVGRTVDVGAGRRTRIVTVRPGRRWRRRPRLLSRAERPPPRAVPARPPARLPSCHQPARSWSCTSSGRWCDPASSDCDKEPGWPMRSRPPGAHGRGRTSLPSTSRDSSSTASRSECRGRARCRRPAAAWPDPRVPVVAREDPRLVPVHR